VQAAPVCLDLSRTLEKTRTLVREAAKRVAELVAFPNPGYPDIPRGSIAAATSPCGTTNP
jgi:hypothetical protein